MKLLLNSFNYYDYNVFDDEESQYCKKREREEWIEEDELRTKLLNDYLLEDETDEADKTDEDSRHNEDSRHKKGKDPT